MIGIGIVTHNDVIDKSEKDTELTEPLKLVTELINTIDLFTDDYVLIIRDNDSFDYRFKRLDILLKNRYKNINIVFIASEINDLTHAWNQIVNVGLNDLGCEGICLLNQDVLITKYWKPFITAIRKQRRDLIAPMTDGAVYQDLQRVSNKEFEPEDCILQVPSIQGFCFGGSKLCFESNMYDEDNYFDPEISWDFNEEEWQQRNNNSGGRSLILKNSYVIHLDQGLWLKAGLRSAKRPELYSDNYRLTVLNKYKYSDLYNIRE